MARQGSAGRAGAAASSEVRGAVREAGAAIEYEVVRSARRRKTIEITLDGGDVRVAAPLRTSRREIDDFVQRRAPWILKHRDRPADRREPLAYATGEALPFQGGMLPLLVSTHRTPGVTVMLDLFNLHLGVAAALEGARRRQAIESALLDWYGARARDAVETSVARWARVMQQWPHAVLVRNQRSRWGSCAPDGTLRFNWRLVMLDPALLDYVVVHELTHLGVDHHGPAFWRAMERVLPDQAARRQRMREVAGTLPF